MHIFHVAETCEQAVERSIQVDVVVEQEITFSRFNILQPVSIRGTAHTTQASTSHDLVESGVLIECAVVEQVVLDLLLLLLLLLILLRVGAELHSISLCVIVAAAAGGRRLWGKTDWELVGGAYRPILTLCLGICFRSILVAYGGPPEVEGANLLFLFALESAETRKLAQVAVKRAKINAPFLSSLPAISGPSFSNRFSHQSRRNYFFSGHASAGDNDPAGHDLMTDRGESI